MMSKSFGDYFKAEKDAFKASDDLLAKYAGKVPVELIEVWKSSGLGRYNQGLLQMVIPSEYEPSLWTWLGREVPNYVPFAITGFGELLYYRKLSDTDEDICLVDIQYRKIEVLTWSMGEFLHDFLLNEANHEDWLRESLFKEAVSHYGEPKRDEVFTFVPVLAFGGGVGVEFLKKGNAQVYQQLVFQMTS